MLIEWITFFNSNFLTNIIHVFVRRKLTIFWDYKLIVHQMFSRFSIVFVDWTMMMIDENFRFVIEFFDECTESRIN